MANIFQISNDLRKAYEMAETGDFSDEAVRDTIEAIQWELTEKADNYVNLIAEIMGEIDVITEEEARLQNLKRSKKNFIDRLKNNLYQSMKLTENEKFKTPLHSYWIQMNPPALNVTDEAKIPGDYFITPAPQLDKARLKEFLLKGGGAVEGAEITQGEGVRYR